MVNAALGLNASGRRDEVLEAIEEAVAVYRRLRAGDPWAYEPGLAVSLHNVAPGLRRVARNQDALAAIKEAVTMQRRLATCNPTAHEPILGDDTRELLTALAISVGVGRRWRRSRKPSACAAGSAGYRRPTAGSIEIAEQPVCLAGRGAVRKRRPPLAVVTSASSGALWRPPWSLLRATVRG